MSYEPTVWVDGDHVTSAKLNKLEEGVNSMSYVPTVWSAGDVVTAEKLNKLEQGVADSGGGGGGDLVYPTFTMDAQTQTITCDKTFAECLAMCKDNEIVENEWFCYIDGMSELGVMINVGGEDSDIQINVVLGAAGGEVFFFYYHSDGTIDFESPK